MPECCIIYITLLNVGIPPFSHDWCAFRIECLLDYARFGGFLENIVAACICGRCIVSASYAGRHGWTFPREFSFKKETAFSCRWGED